MYGISSASDSANKLCAQRYVKRLANSKLREAKKHLNHRQKIRAAKRKLAAEFEAAEGGPVYGPGIASLPKKKKPQKKGAKGPYKGPYLKGSK